MYSKKNIDALGRIISDDTGPVRKYDFFHTYPDNTYFLPLVSSSEFIYISCPHSQH